MTLAAPFRILNDRLGYECRLGEREADAAPGSGIWLAMREPSSIFVSGPGLMEQSYGAERYWHKTGSRRYLEHLARVRAEFLGRIVEFVDPAPLMAGKVRRIAKRSAVRYPSTIP